MALPAADDDNERQFTMPHIVDTHMRGKDLSVVYTNELVSVESSIHIMEQFLAEDKYQVVGLDLEALRVFRQGSTKNKQDSPVDLASYIIEPYYMKMKDESKKDKIAWQSAWEQRLDEEHVKYAAKDAYTSYEMYRRIVDMGKCLRPAPDWGSSHRAVAAASQEVDD
ncbi:uncharacterized protein [Aegilops tauschii subsp. strangulata]|uniref:uncharacterized protein n=1 Tax=Aegilops tauschii subsp. strangulata TaxID=200361 RepID=UPI003CC8580B